MKTKKYKKCSICNSVFIERLDCKSITCSYECKQNLVIQKTRERTKNEWNTKILDYANNPNYCRNCWEILPYLKKGNKFCCKSCSVSYSNKKRGPRTEATKEKISDKLAKITKSDYEKNPKYCKWCNKILPYRKRNNSCCDRHCVGSYWISNLDTSKKKLLPCVKCNKMVESHILAGHAICDGCLGDYSAYRRSCNFKFDIKIYPDWFDISKENLSKDHMLSIYDGFKNKIDPSIMSHPANCELLTNIENSSKNKNSSISLEQLIERIEIFDSKYK